MIMNYVINDRKVKPCEILKQLCDQDAKLSM